MLKAADVEPSKTKMISKDPIGYVDYEKAFDSIVHNLHLFCKFRMMFT